MAGGFGNKSDPKWKNFKVNTNEVVKDSDTGSSAPKSETKSIFSLHGILGLNQTVEINQTKDSLEFKAASLYGSFNHLEKESQVLFDNHQRELEKSLNELRGEINNLIKSTANLEKSVENLAVTPMIEANDYQLNFLNRIRIFIAGFRQEINQAGLWLEAFAAKKKKRNYFWNTVRNKKSGGEQYLNSGEHSAARSAG